MTDDICILNNFGNNLWLSTFIETIATAAINIIGPVIVSMTCHLLDSAAQTPIGTATILGTTTLSRWDVVFVTDSPTGLTDRNKNIESPNNTNDRGQGTHDLKGSIRFEGSAIGTLPNELTKILIVNLTGTPTGCGIHNDL